MHRHPMSLLFCIFTSRIIISYNYNYLSYLSPSSSTSAITSFSLLLINIMIDILSKKIYLIFIEIKVFLMYITLVIRLGLKRCGFENGYWLFLEERERDHSYNHKVRNHLRRIYCLQNLFMCFF